jgi:hypothetical protein
LPAGLLDWIESQGAGHVSSFAFGDDMPPSSPKWGTDLPPGRISGAPNQA